jgi:hypothetical protein
VRAGALGGARLLVAVEEHGQGRQLLRHRIWPRWSRSGVAVAAFFGGSALVAGLHDATATAAILAVCATAVSYLIVRDCAAAVALCLHVLRLHEQREAEAPEQPSQRRDAPQRSQRVDVAFVEGTPE